MKTYSNSKTRTFIFPWPKINYVVLDGAITEGKSDNDAP